MDSDKNKAMETNDKITDELIAKYISGKATEEEESLVHEHLARNPEFANDLLDIATAIKQQHRHDEAMQQENHDQTHEAKHVRLTPRRTFYAIAASVVILIGIGVLVFKPFARHGMKQTVVAEADSKAADTSGNDEEILITETPSISVEPEQPLLADSQEHPEQNIENNTEPPLEKPSPANNQANPIQNAGNITEPQLADNSSKDALLEQYSDDLPLEASLTISNDYSDTLKEEDVIFNIENMPESCNPDEDLVLNWTCNATSLTLEFSTDEGKTWMEPKYNITDRENFTIKRDKLRSFTINNPYHCFYWRMTAKYQNGDLTHQGKVMFSR